MSKLGLPVNHSGQNGIQPSQQSGELKKNKNNVSHTRFYTKRFAHNISMQYVSDRRTYLSLVECYKIVSGFYHLKFEELFDLATTQSTRANHQYKLYVKPARLNCYKNSFFIRIVKLWNKLPRNIVEADNLQHFKSKLKLYLNI